MDIKITKVAKSNFRALDFDKVTFGSVYTDHMFVVDYEDGQWGKPEIKPLAPLSVHPGNLAWHYGQSIFEGMKAYKGEDGRPLLFRVEEHIKRLNASATRMCMPELPGEMFESAVKTLVELEEKWIPTVEGGSLYLRPFMVAMDEAIGVKPSSKYTFIILALPVGPYYSKPVKLYADDKYIRACHGGVGEAKTAGNYAASLYPAKLAKEKGYDQIMWLDAKEFKYIQEVGVMNIFFVIDGKIITPETNGTILKGITRKSIIEILRDQGHTVEERLISIDEVKEASKAGTLSEVFGSGTAAVVSNVCEIKHKDDIIKLDVDSFDISLKVKKYLTDLRVGKIEDKFGWVEKL